MKKYYIIVLLALAIAASGCTGSGENQFNTEEQAQDQNQPPQIRNDRFAMFEDMPEAQKTDLVAGAYVSIFGSSSSDGSISADRILIGNDASDFQSPLRPSAFPLGENKEELSASSGALPGGFDGQRPDFSGFESMSDEERAQMREQMTARRGDIPSGFSGARPSFGSGSSGQQVARMQGDVLKVDENSLVLKVDEGSKLVFFSDDTVFNFLPQ